MRHKSAALVFIVVVAAGFCSACGRGKTTTVMDLSGAPRMQDGLRSDVIKSQMHEFAGTFDARVQIAADQIIRNAHDVEIRRNAMLWKANAIPAIRLACYRRNAIAAVLDTYVFCIQMEEFFRDGAGSDVFGDQQALAVATAESFVRDIRELSRPLMRLPEYIEDVEHEDIRPWAEANPLEGLSFARPSIIPLFMNLIPPNNDFFQTVASVEELLFDLNKQLRIYAANLPEETRWQAEMVRDETMASEDVQRALGRFDEMGESLVSLARSLDEVAGLIETERMSIEKTVAQERTLVVEAIAAEREAVLGAITAERQEMLAALDAQRIDSHERLTAERKAVAESLDRKTDRIVEYARDERKETVEAVTSFLAATLDDAESDFAAVVDHALWRLLQGLIGLALIAPLLIVVYGRIARWALLRPAA